MLSRIKYKSLIALESILEGNNDKMTLKHIMKVISVNILKDNIGYIFEKFDFVLKRYYSDDAFNNMNIDYK